MPRDGSGAALPPPGTSATPNTTILSTAHNALRDDTYAILNQAWPTALGGTGGTTPAALLAGQNVFSATQSWDKGADIASAATLTLGNDGNYFDVTGTATISAVSTKPIGTVVFLQFDAAATLVHNATSLILLGGANIVAAPNDSAMIVSEGSGNWRMLSYQRASGQALVGLTAATVSQIRQGTPQSFIEASNAQGAMGFVANPNDTTTFDIKAGVNQTATMTAARTISLANLVEGLPVTIVLAGAFSHSYNASHFNFKKVGGVPTTAYAATEISGKIRNGKLQVNLVADVDL